MRALFGNFQSFNDWVNVNLALYRCYCVVNHVVYIGRKQATTFLTVDDT